jgi:hypothetical protein
MIHNQRGNTMNLRLAYIEAAILVGGYVKRKDIMEIFKIKDAQASRTFTEYHKRYPNKIILDPSTKVYKANGKLLPLVLVDDPIKFLAYLSRIKKYF